AILSAVQAQWPSLQMLDPIPYLCNQHLCAGLSGNQLLYVDSNHLSLAGSRLVAAGFSFAARR
ncbi:MAG TPA: SGNH hydrolase domain-containing protein, partial [Vicinamibacterales bacterium]|nr:SGNH hydrolase domain-containing protein [Vicinamibacterales bacterium]